LREATFTAKGYVPAVELLDLGTLIVRSLVPLSPGNSETLATEISTYESSSPSTSTVITSTTLLEFWMKIEALHCSAGTIVRWYGVTETWAKSVM